MGKSRVKAVLFDLGETLLNFGKVDAGRLFLESAIRTYAFLENAGQPLGGFRRYFWRNLIGLRFKLLVSYLTHKDFDSLTALKKAGEKEGIHLSAEQWEELNWQWYEPLYRRTFVEKDIVETLGKLRDAGLKLGIVSNTFVSGGVLERHLAKEEMLDFFDVRVYSYEFRRRKPDGELFLEAARRIGEAPADILFVGDRIDADIKGATKVGMRPVLKRAYTNAGKKVEDGLLTIESISELPSIVSSLAGSDS